MRKAILAFLCCSLAAACGDKKSTPPARTEAPAPGRAKQIASSGIPDKKPPSSGKEMPRFEPPHLSREQAVEVLKDAVAKVRAGTADCDKTIPAIEVALPAVGDKITEETRAPYEALQLCAERGKHYQTLLNVSYALLDAGFGHPAFVVSALNGLGRYQQAIDAAVGFAKAKPEWNDDPALAALTGFAALGKEDYPSALKMAELTYKAATGAQDEQRRVALTMRAAIIGFKAFYFMGRFDEASNAIDKWASVAPGSAEVTRARSLTAQAKLNHAIVEPIFSAKVSLGIYHLYATNPKAAGSLLKLETYNFADGDRQFHVEAEIPGITEKTTQSVMVLKGARQDFHLTPPLKVGFDLASVRAEQPAQLNIKVSAADESGERTVYEESLPITLLPRDHLPLTRAIGRDAEAFTLDYIASWVTPNAAAVDAFLAKAKKRAPGGNFVGEQAGTLPQVQALFEELKADGMTYVMDPRVVSDVGMVQRTRLPGEVLASTNAQCLEGTILFATLMEAIGLRPLIVIVPGHAFVGWHATSADGVAQGEPIFVETTMVGNAPFEAAVKVAGNRVVEEAKSGNFKRGRSHVLDLDEVRKQGFTPQPSAN